MASPQLATSPAAESFFPTTFPRQRLADFSFIHHHGVHADESMTANVTTVN
jgi:hypothetical protein